MEIEKKVKDILAELSSKKEINSESLLREELALDSLSLITLLIGVEEAFNIELQESDMNPFDLNTVQSVIDMVKKYIGEENE